MKSLQKNHLLQNSLLYKFYKVRVIIFCLLWNSLVLKGQIANYVNNGGFEGVVLSGANPPLAKYWGATDSLKLFGELMTANLPPYNVPLSSYSYQWPRHGSNYLATTNFCSSCSSNIRGYPKNRLKQPLQNGKTYCFLLYLNLTNKSSYAIDALGIYFADSSLDTIKYCSTPLTYLNPQIENPNGTFLSDTLNWILFKGLYTSNGNEKYALIGNYLDNVNTNKLLVNSSSLPQVFASYLYDDISLIDVDLPAFAGRDTVIYPGKSVFIGREPDVGIDEACIWYKYPDMINSIDTLAGFWINPTSTSTYVVKQQLLCSSDIKWDTVVIETSIYVGMSTNVLLPNEIQLFPNPAKDFLEIKIRNQELTDKGFTIAITNNLGQIIREEEIIFQNKRFVLKTNDFEEGVYFFNIKSNTLNTVSKRFVISR